MTGDEANEVLAIVRRICPVVLSAAVSLSGDVGTALRRSVGLMQSDKAMTELAVFCFAFNCVVDLVRHCGATLVTMDRIRLQALSEAPVGLPAVQTVLAIVRLTLAMEARIVAYMSFASRDEVDQIATAIHAAFEQTSEIAADDHDAATYMAVAKLHGDVTQMLAGRGRLLPRIIAYRNQAPLPALRMAQAAYADPTRYLELIAENSVVHPAFMPVTGKMLAV